MIDWSILAGPAIGAVIGYFTNYLAVKMLFRPRNEVTLMGKTLPFTPGVIPKEKSRLAKAIGKTVADKLLTEEDMGKHLLSEEMKTAVADRTEEILSGDIKSEIMDITGMDENLYVNGKEQLCDTVSQQIFNAVSNMPVKEKVTEAMLSGVNEKLNELKTDGMMGGMIAMMLPPERIASLIEPIGDKIVEHIDEHGMDYIRPVLEQKVSHAENMNGLEIAEMFGMTREGLRESVKSIYENLVRQNIASLFEHMDIAALIEEKINAMDVMELEDLVMSVMKKELNTIVRLGALIGLIIGMLNIFV